MLRDHDHDSYHVCRVSCLLCDMCHYVIVIQFVPSFIVIVQLLTISEKPCLELEPGSMNSRQITSRSRISTYKEITGLLPAELFLILRFAILCIYVRVQFECACALIEIAKLLVFSYIALMLELLNCWTENVNCHFVCTLQGFIHVRIWFPQLPGVVMLSDQEVIIMCKPPSPTITQSKTAGFAGSM